MNPFVNDELASPHFQIVQNRKMLTQHADNIVNV